MLRMNATSQKSLGHFLQTPQMKYEFISKHRFAFRVEKMYRALKVSRSGYYAWVGRGSDVTPFMQTIADGGPNYGMMLIPYQFYELSFQFNQAIVNQFASNARIHIDYDNF